MLLKVANVKIWGCSLSPLLIAPSPLYSELIELKRQYSYNLNYADHRTSLVIAEKGY